MYDLKGYEFKHIKYDKVVQDDITVFFKPSNSILVGTSTPVSKYELFFNPWSFSMDTKRIKTIPDEGVQELRAESINMKFDVQKEIQELVLGCPRARGDTSLAEEYCARDLHKFQRKILRDLLLCEASGFGLLWILIFYTFGASSAGWLNMYLTLIDGFSQIPRAFREVQRIALVQVSTELIGFGLEKRREAARRLIEICDVSLLFSFPRVYRAGRWIRDRTQAIESVNQLISFFEYLPCSEHENGHRKKFDEYRQPGDLHALLDDWNGKAFIPTEVMTQDVFREVLREPDKASMLSPIPVSLSYKEPAVLICLASSRGVASQCAESFLKAFEKGEVIAGYEGLSLRGDTRLLILVPIDGNKLEEALMQAGEKEYQPFFQ